MSNRITDLEHCHGKCIDIRADGKYTLPDTEFRGKPSFCEQNMAKKHGSSEDESITDLLRVFRNEHKHRRKTKK